MGAEVAAVVVEARLPDEPEARQAAEQRLVEQRLAAEPPVDVQAVAPRAQRVAPPADEAERPVVQRSLPQAVGELAAQRLRLVAALAVSSRLQPRSPGRRTSTATR